MLSYSLYSLLTEHCGSSVKAKISTCPLDRTLTTFVSSCLPNQCTIIVDIINKSLEIRLVPWDLKTFHSSVKSWKEQFLPNSSNICLSMNSSELVSDYIAVPGMLLSRAQMTSSSLQTLHVSICILLYLSATFDIASHSIILDGLSN